MTRQRIERVYKTHTGELVTLAIEPGWTCHEDWIDRAFRAIQPSGAKMEHQRVVNVGEEVGDKQ